MARIFHFFHLMALPFFFLLFFYFFFFFFLLLFLHKTHTHIRSEGVLFQVYIFYLCACYNWTNTTCNNWTNATAFAQLNCTTYTCTLNHIWLSRNYQHLNRFLLVIGKLWKFYWSFTGRCTSRPLAILRPDVNCWKCCLFLLCHFWR